MAGLSATPARAGSVDLIETVVDVPLGLGVEHELLNADVQKLTDKIVVLAGHQMHVEGHARACAELCDGVQPQRHARTEMAVENVHMQQLNAAVLQRFDRLLQIAQVTAGNQRGGENAAFVPDAHWPYSSFP